MEKNQETFSFGRFVNFMKKEYLLRETFLFFTGIFNIIGGQKNAGHNQPFCTFQLNFQNRCCPSLSSSWKLSITSSISSAIWRRTLLKCYWIFFLRSIAVFSWLCNVTWLSNFRTSSNVFLVGAFVVAEVKNNNTYIFKTPKDPYENLFALFEKKSKNKSKFFVQPPLLLTQIFPRDIWAAPTLSSAQLVIRSLGKVFPWKYHWILL